MHVTKRNNHMYREREERQPCKWSNSQFINELIQDQQIILQ